jgi:CheY-like chemotaxis protein
MAMKELRRILHVEDDDDILQLVKLSLELLGGYELLQCASGREALEKAEGFAPDLILIDFMMPDMNGHAALMALRKLPALRDVPAVFMTAKDLRLDADPGIAAAAIGTIAKPFDAMALPNQVRALWTQGAIAGH